MWEEAVTKVLKKARYDNSYMSYYLHTTRELSWSIAVGADLVASSDIII